MELTWWGTAGFHVKTGDHEFLIDPYLTRNSAARPKQTLTPSDITAAGQIFVSHGHFDHVLDIPAIASENGSRVYCCTETASTLKQNGLNGDQIRESHQAHRQVPVRPDDLQGQHGAQAGESHVAAAIQEDVFHAE